MKWSHKIQGSLPQILHGVLHHDFTEQQMQAYFTKDDTWLRRLMWGAFITGIVIFYASFVSPTASRWSIPVSFCILFLGVIIFFSIKLGIQMPTDQEYEVWVARKAVEELQKGLIELDLEDLSKEERDHLLVVRGYAVPGTKDEKNFLKEDIRWKKGKDGEIHYSINIYTYLIPLEHRIASLTFHINAMNFHDRSQGIGEYFYSGIVSVQTRDEREFVIINDEEQLYHTQSFLLSSSDGKGVSVTIRSLPLKHNAKLPEFDFADPRVEDTIRRMRRLLRSIKQQDT